MPAIVHASLTAPAGVSSAFCWEGEDVFQLHRPPLKFPPGGERCQAIVCDVEQYPEQKQTLDAEEARRLAARAVENTPGLCVCVVAVCGTPCHAFISRSGALEQAELCAMPTRAELYSRSRGILEGEVLAPKSALIIGLGSFGSLVAVELAKAGLGNFTLIDFDRVGCENLARHVCGWSDLGRLKTHAMRDAIWQKNPHANVQTLEADINSNLEQFRDLAARTDLIICLTDENRSRLNANQACLDLKKTGLFARAITRAAGGDVFRLRPGGGACLNCLFGAGLFASDQEEISNTAQVRRVAPAYTDPAEAAATVQVGLSCDIIPITNLVVKLALLELSRGLPSGLGCLDEDLAADFYIWANRREESYANWPPMGTFYNRNSILRWYGAEVSRDPACLVCGDLDPNSNLITEP